MVQLPLSPDLGDTRSMLNAAAEVHGDREAYAEPGARISIAEWIDRARGVATQFAEFGVGKGDVVMVWLPSGIDYATCYAAAAMIGAITTGLNTRLGSREVESILYQADPLATDPGVKEAVVVGRTAAVIGEIGVAFVVPVDDTNPPTLQELRAFVSLHLADYKAPDEVVIADGLPLTSMLKPNRTALRASFSLPEGAIKFQVRTG